MAVVRIPDENRALTDAGEITRYLAGIGIDCERWEPAAQVAPQAPAEEVLAAYAPQIEQLKACGGYVTADVIDVSAQTPGLWGERSVSSIANLTRRDGEEFMRIAAEVNLQPAIETFPLERANEALNRLRHGRLKGAAVLVN